MSEKVRLVIIGSGIVGCAVAYHLTQFGWRDIVLIDKGELFENDGSTSHAPGGVVPLSHSKLLTQLGSYTSRLISGLKPFRTDRNTFNRVGQLEVAISETRWQDLIRLHGESQGFGCESHLLTLAETKAKLPIINEEAFVGSLFIPSGGICKGADVSAALARDAEATGGARFIGHTAMTDIEVTNGRVAAVLTDNPAMPRIECEQVLLCANIWAPALSEKLGVALPLMAFEHQYVRTKPLPQLAQFDRNDKDQEVIYPTTRELDSAMYYRQHWDGYGIGSYWHRPHMVRPRELQKTAINPFTPDDFFGQPWGQAQNLLPVLRDAEIESGINGMFAFSIDGMPIIGESRVKGFWAAVASWITHAGGVAKSVAEWMDTGEPEWDMRQAHIHRFHGFQTTDAYTSVITKKNYREVYDIVHPRQSVSEPRNVRLSPFYPRLQDLKAEYTAFAGVELPNWFEENSRLLEKYDDRIPARTGWATQHWSRIQGAEHLATRENVALFDLTGLSIIEVKGSGAAACVNYLCSNQMDVAVGRVVYTTWLTPKGGVKRDLTVARVAADSFWLFVGEGTLPQDLAWVQQYAPQDGSVTVADISNSYTALGLWGPNARKVLEKVTTADVSNESFPYFTAQWITIGLTPVLALRISYAGELGWELHFPVDMALQTWDLLWEAGREFDMVAAGMGAFDSLRLEKGYRLWGGDVYTEYNPYESGLGWTVKLKKGDFIGREACLKLKDKPLKKKLCCLTFNNGGMALGYEAIFADGQCIGHVTSANYGYAVEKFVMYGYLPSAQTQEGTQLEIEYFGERYPATVVAEPLYDPNMEKLKS
ncbi:MAG: FAD-dependent oxidoreductase [Anaerolineales bacterium]|nr:FAD-dependent oxidoreductase [Anaerolineales bacterium]